MRLDTECAELRAGGRFEALDGDTIESLDMGD